jgi:hypothetical protein
MAVKVWIIGVNQPWAKVKQKTNLKFVGLLTIFVNNIIIPNFTTQNENQDRKCISNFSQSYLLSVS